MVVFLIYEKGATATLMACFSLTSEYWHYSVQEGVLTTFLDVNHLLETYTTDESIAKAHSETGRYVESSTASALKFANEFWHQTLKCPHDFNAYVLEMDLRRRNTAVHDAQYAGILE